MENIFLVGEKRFLTKVIVWVEASFIAIKLKKHHSWLKALKLGLILCI
jgi:hypothetical protein